MTGLGIILAHLVGDYLIQSHWMAVEKVHRWWPAVAHGATYTVPYVFVTQSPTALAVIAVTHVLIDRWRLAKHIVWFKNLFAPEAYRAPHTDTGYPTDTPAWLAVWLLIVADNTMHLLVNTAAVIWL